MPHTISYILHAFELLMTTGRMREKRSRPYQSDKHICSSSLDISASRHSLPKHPRITLEYYTCSEHWTAHCFLNEEQCNAGFVKKLLLKDEAVLAVLGITAVISQSVLSNLKKEKEKKKTFYD